MDIIILLLIVSNIALCTSLLLAENRHATRKKEHAVPKKDNRFIGEEEQL
jgi:predicted small lipoprotein YifL